MKINLFSLMVTKTRFLRFVICFLLISYGSNAQNPRKAISMFDVKPQGLMIVGPYSQLIKQYGEPNNRFFSKINPINKQCIKHDIDVAPKNQVLCEYLVYDAYEYIHIGDSVQLVFIDIRKTDFPLMIENIPITKTMTQNEFLDIARQNGLWSDSLSCYYIGTIDSHYYTDTDVMCYGIDIKEDPYSTVLITFYNQKKDKRIWWIEFPIMRLNGIVH